MKDKKILTLIVSLSLVLMTAVGITVAYFTDYESAKGGATLNLSGETWIDEDADDTHKDVVIQNVGETEMIVRVLIIGDDSHMTVSDDQSGWIKSSKDGYYYCKTILQPDPEKAGNGGRSATLHAEINVTGDEDISQFDIIVMHESSVPVYGANTANGIVCPAGWDADAVAQITAE